MIGGGGLFGHLGYDGAVYYAAAVGVASGQAPYRDFLLLHPPGIVVSLLPFADLGRLIGDPSAMAVARVAWMAMGACSAVVAALIFRRYGTGPALVAGLSYAVFLPAIRVEHSTTLEAPGSLCVLVAMALLTRPSLDGQRSRRRPHVTLCGDRGLSSRVRIRAEDLGCRHRRRRGDLVSGDPGAPGRRRGGRWVRGDGRRRVSAVLRVRSRRDVADGGGRPDGSRAGSGERRYAAARHRRPVRVERRGTARRAGRRGTPLPSLRLRWRGASRPDSSASCCWRRRCWCC